MTSSAKTYDYVIAGGGSAACVAAMRLVRDLGARVLILERGKPRYHWLMRMPAGYMKFFAREDFLGNAPDRAAGPPRRPCADRAAGAGARRRKLGQRHGLHARPARGLRRLGAHLGAGSGWSYDDMLPHFRSLERNARFNDAYHGIGGGLMVSDPGQLSDTTEDFILAAQGCGVPWNPDFNGARQSGVGVMQHTMGIVDG